MIELRQKRHVSIKWIKTSSSDVQQSDMQNLELQKWINLQLL